MRKALDRMNSSSSRNLSACVLYLLEYVVRTLTYIVKHKVYVDLLVECAVCVTYVISLSYVLLSVYLSFLELQ